PPAAPSSPSLHDALPIFLELVAVAVVAPVHMALAGADALLGGAQLGTHRAQLEAVGLLAVQLLLDLVDLGVVGEVLTTPRSTRRSEEHTSELQSRFELVC